MFDSSLREGSHAPGIIWNCRNSPRNPRVILPLLQEHNVTNHIMHG
ncbi:hypothetical protein HanHA89_Chr14g0564121 [Helianthus annuus]|nr:hypothetical protein HanHA89_Chr14g0564121 [Helianthus annuus]